MSDKQYGHDDARDYEPYFSRHLMAMTTEDLHSKGEIACELAYRDHRIAELEADRNAWRESAEQLGRQVASLTHNIPTDIPLLGGGDE